MPQPKTNIVEHASTGLHIPESLANLIDEQSKGIPADFKFMRMARNPKKFESAMLEDGSRTDLSEISTDDPDHEDEVIIPSGGDTKVFMANPVVMFAHRYDQLPVGKAMWLKTEANSIIGKTRFASRPAGFSDWLPDAIFSMQQEGMLKGKSIGLIPISKRTATSEEIGKRPDWKGKTLTDKWVMLEYSIAPIPMNPYALTMAVSKCVQNEGFKSLILTAAGIDPKAVPISDPTIPATGTVATDQVTAAMPTCPNCGGSDVVKKDDDGGMYCCMKCDTQFDAKGVVKPKAVIVIPPVVKSAEEIAKEIKQKKLDDAMEIVVPFVSPMTLKNYTERKIQDQIDDLVSKALVDTRMRAQGRA